jgi:hypothetical protein
MNLSLFLPPTQNGFLRSVAEEDQSFLEAIYNMAYEYSEIMGSGSEQETELALDMFLRMVEAGFFKIICAKNSGVITLEVRAWSPIERTYKLPQDFTPEEMGIAEGLQEYFMSSN